MSDDQRTEGTEREACRDCAGSGRVPGFNCSRCGGSGKTWVLPARGIDYSTPLPTEAGDVEPTEGTERETCDEVGCRNHRHGENHASCPCCASTPPTEPAEPVWTKQNWAGCDTCGPGYHPPHSHPLPTEAGEGEASLVSIFVDLVWPIEDAREAARAVIAAGWRKVVN